MVYRRLALALAFLTFFAARASAQGFISGFIGTAFSKPPLEACSFSSGCQDGQRTYGFAIGGVGSILGAEFDLGYTKAFFGELGSGQSSGLTTMMGNLILGPRIAFVQPYGVGGIGVLRMHVDSLTSTLTENDETKFAWDLGGGVIVHLGRHVGVRGDIRHIRAFQDFELAGGITIPGSDLNFNRASASIVLKF